MGDFPTRQLRRGRIFCGMGPLSDELLARIVALAADAIICTNAKQIITFFNDGATRIFGYSSDEIMGQPLSILIPDRYRSAHHHHIDEFGHSPVAARQMGERNSISGVRKNGEEFPAEAAIAKMIGPNGPIYSVVLRDVTAQREAYETNRRLLADTAAAVKARDEMLGLVSHDLRNPVNAVKMLAAAILRTEPETPKETIPAVVFEHANVMLQAAHQMDALIQDLLDVSRIESGRMHLALGPVAVSDATRAAVDMLQPLANERNVRIVVAFGESLATANADHDRIVQLLSNLVGNAIKFSPSGSTVKIDATCDEEFITVRVADNGIGIAADELPFVFDRFWQSRRTNRSGAGLGLAIARGIVRAHGGDIHIASTLGEGTTVSFALPRAR